MNHKVFPGATGMPNNVSFWLSDDVTIVCISDEPLEPTERRVIQILLGVNESAGFTEEISETRDGSGKYITQWTYWR